jgi:hypothetical protein
MLKKVHNRWLRARLGNLFECLVAVPREIGRSGT